MHHGAAVRCPVIGKALAMSGVGHVRGGTDVTGVVTIPVSGGG
jgi:hypothetical protein